MKVILLLLAIISLALSKEPVKVTLLVEAEDDDGDDFMAIKLFISKQDESLNKALLEAEKIANQISNKAKGFCEIDTKNKKCGEATQIEKPEIQSKYQIVRKESTFQHFVVKRQITINVYKADTLGPLVDQLQKLGVSKFQEFVWKSEDEQEQEQIVINNAKQRANNLCGAFDYKFERVLEVTQINPEKEQEEKQDANDDEDQDQPNIYQVVVECVSSKPAKK